MERHFLPKEDNNAGSSPVGESFGVSPIGMALGSGPRGVSQQGVRFSPLRLGTFGLLWTRNFYEGGEKRPFVITQGIISVVDY